MNSKSISPTLIVVTSKDEEIWEEYVAARKVALESGATLDIAKAVRLSNLFYFGAEGGFAT